VPYLAWRDGRPRWVPGPRLRAKGFKGRDLKDEQGRWLGLEAAIDAARALNAEVEAWRAKGAPRFRAKRPAANPHSCRALMDHFVGNEALGIRPSPAFLELAPKTQGDYVSKLRIFIAARIDDDTTFGDYPVTAIKPNHLYKWWEELYRERGHTMANGTIAVVRLMFSYALPQRLNWLEHNPAIRLRLPGVPPRLVVWTPSEIDRFIAVADGMGLHSVADAFVIALHTGQRRADVLELRYERVVNGRARFRQGKTKARVSVPLTPPLEQRLAQIRTRRIADAGGGIADLTRISHLVIAETTGEPYKGDWFTKKFAEARAAAAADDEGGEEGAHKAIAAKQFLDLRDTAVTRLALANCSLQEICAITGHTLESATRIMRHYMAIDDRMADSAIEKLKAWMAEEGIAV
jgi:integrase